MNVTLLHERFVGNVREAMASAGVNQSDLARRMGVTRSLVSQYMSGHRTPGLDVVVRFAIALGIDDPCELLELKEASVAS